MCARMNRMEKTRNTWQRQCITDILDGAQTPLTATEVYRRAAQRAPALAKSTVYRNLDAMVERGELERGFLENGESFFVLADRGHHHYMICRDCNRMQHLPECPIAHLQPDLAETSGFVPVDHIVQVYGYCRDCAQNHSKSD